MDSNYDVIQGNCPCCPFSDLFTGYCSYYNFYPANINFGEVTCRCEELKKKINYEYNHTNVAAICRRRHHSDSCHFNFYCRIMFYSSIVA